VLLHRTQFGADHFLVRVPADAFAGLWNREHFMLIAGPSSVPAGELETDLFAGIV